MSFYSIFTVAVAHLWGISPSVKTEGGARWVTRSEGRTGPPRLAERPTQTFLIYQESRRAGVTSPLYLNGVEMRHFSPIWDALMYPRWICLCEL